MEFVCLRIKMFAASDVQGRAEGEGGMLTNCGAICETKQQQCSEEDSCLHDFLHRAVLRRIFLSCSDTV
jgi:hypothetical protein